jgi:hypothetical protein
VVTDVQNAGSRLARDYWQYEWVDNPCSPAYNPQAAAAAGLSRNVAKLAKRFGVSQQEMREAIHDVKRQGAWRGGKYRNPDVVIDENGEAYPLGPDGEPAEDSIGNILDFLGDY